MRKTELSLIELECYPCSQLRQSWQKGLLTLTTVEIGCTLLKFFIIVSARSATERPIAHDVYPFSLMTS